MPPATAPSFTRLALVLGLLSAVGPIATAPLVGVALSRFGPAAVPTTLAALAGLAFLSAVWLRRRR